MDKADAASTTAVLRGVSKQHFNGGPLDSDLTGNEPIKRKEVLEDLEELPFQAF
jgi:hypothetical protein